MENEVKLFGIDTNVGPFKFDHKVGYTDWLGVMGSHHPAPHCMPERPPLGLKPKSIHQREIAFLRSQEIRAAVIRHLNFDGLKSIPLEWIEEYNELMEVLGNGEARS